MDVDPQLISQARGHLKDILRQEQVEKAYREIPVVKAATKESRDRDVEPFAEVNGKAETDGSKAQTTTKALTSTITSDRDTFAMDMPLSFRLWKPSMHGQDAVPRAIGKAAIGYVNLRLMLSRAVGPCLLAVFVFVGRSAFPLNVVFKREDIVLDVHAGKDYDFVTW